MPEADVLLGLRGLLAVDRTARQGVGELGQLRLGDVDVLESSGVRLEPEVVLLGFEEED